MASHKAWKWQIFCWRKQLEAKKILAIKSVCSKIFVRKAFSNASLTFHFSTMYQIIIRYSSFRHFTYCQLNSMYICSVCLDCSNVNHQSLARNVCRYFNTPCSGLIIERLDLYNVHTWLIICHLYLTVKPVVKKFAPAFVKKKHFRTWADRPIVPVNVSGLGERKGR
jgi:hypothetical protein